LNISAAALALHGSEYGSEGAPGLFAEMKAAGLVAVFGASDDLMEFRGAIADEEYCLGDGDVHLDQDGLLENECTEDECPHFTKLKSRTRAIKAIWDRDGISWQYETSIPHKTFDVMEDGEVYCRGIVFQLADAK